MIYYNIHILKGYTSEWGSKVTFLNSSRRNIKTTPPNLSRLPLANRSAFFSFFIFLSLFLSLSLIDARLFPSIWNEFSFLPPYRPSNGGKSPRSPARIFDPFETKWLSMRIGCIVRLYRTSSRTRSRRSGMKEGEERKRKRQRERKDGRLSSIVSLYPTTYQSRSPSRPIW